MILREIMSPEKQLMNSVAGHPLQSWEWGEFKRDETVFVERVGFFDKGKIQRSIQVFFHKIPNTSWFIGYFPKGYMPEEEQLDALRQLGRQYNAIAIKMEPNVSRPVDRLSAHQDIEKFLEKNDARPGRPLFTKYTFVLDLTPPEETLLANLKSKTRYNVNLAEKKGVEVVENTTKEGMDQYIEILKETTKRQGFYAHTPAYFEKMWETLGNSGLLRILEARYEGKVLVSWILFVFGDTLYYPYGSSRDEHRDVMASNLMMWRTIQLGKALGLKKLDMWGALGPEPDKNHPWYGFHRFKEGYGAQLYEFLGTYDLVLNPTNYSLYRIAENVRWTLLRAKARLRRLF